MEPLSGPFYHDPRGGPVVAINTICRPRGSQSAKDMRSDRGERFGRWLKTCARRKSEESLKPSTLSRIPDQGETFGLSRESSQFNGGPAQTHTQSSRRVGENLELTFGRQLPRGLR